MQQSKSIGKIGLALLIIALLIGVLPMQVFAADDIETVLLTVAGTKVTETNKDDILGDGGSVKAAYDADANQVTLTLTNANISYKSMAVYISSTVPMVIDLVGENEISVISGSQDCIYFTNNLTIQGSGSLVLNSAGGSGISNSARGTDPSSLVISGVSSLTANGYYKGMGIVGDLRIENSTVSVSSQQGYYNAAVDVTRNIAISDSTVNVTAQGEGASGITAKGGSISLTDSAVEIDSVRTGLQSYSDTTISAGTLNLSVSEQRQNGIFASGTLTIENGADVTATSTSPALYGATGLTIADSRVRAAASNDLGIWTRGNLSVSGNVDVVSNGIAMVSGCTFTVTPATDSLLEVKAGASEGDAQHITDSPFAAQTTLSRIDDPYCSIKTHVHTGGTATCTTAAVCSDCGQSYGTLDATNHTALTAVEETPATCTATGNIAYWYCADCGKYFRDEACTEEISLEDTVLAMTAHNAVKTEETPATCTEKGNIAYWYCADCGKYFADAACTQEITLEDTVLSETGHQFENGICMVCGMKDPNAQTPETDDEDQNQTPDQSTKPESKPTQESEKQTDSSPQTGDSTALGLWVCLLLTGMAGLTGTVVYRKKKQ